MANKITMDMELRFVDKVTSGAKATSRAFDKVEDSAKDAGEAIDKLGKKKSKPTVDTDTTRIDKKLSKIDSVLRKFGLKKTKTTIDAEDKVTAKIAKAMKKAGEWAGKKFNAFLELKDSSALRTLEKVSGGLKNLTRKTFRVPVKILDYATKPLQALKNTLFSIKGLVAAVTAGLAAQQLVLKPINLADAYSSAQIGFSTLLGDSAGQQMMDDLDVFAKATPFNASQVIAQTQRMLAMGWDAENIIKDMTTIGDAAAATGKGEQGLQQIVTALAQIKTKGRLSTEELNQLAEAGISAKRYLAEGLGYGTGDEGIAAMTKDLEDGAIASNVALQALLAGMKEYQGMMDKTANETASGLWAQLTDTFEINIARRWGQGLQDGVKKSFGTILKLIEEADGALTEFGDTVYEVGKTISNWLADKFENAVERIMEITGSFEFKNASLKEKFSMLWKGVITDPLKEWWDNGGQEKTAETAGEIGSWMGKTLSNVLLSAFGITELLDPEKNAKLAKDGGMSIAQSFVDGFTTNFDGSAITSALANAISNVWGALPGWAKFLIGGYGVGKAAGGLANLAGGVASFAGGVKNVMGGFNIASSAFPLLTSSGSGLLGLLGKAGVGLGAKTAGSAVLMGSAGIAGGVAGGASLIKGGYDLYKGYHTDDKTEAAAYKASGNAAVAGTLGGAAIGTAILPGLGTLIGAGIGGVAGWIGGEKLADDIRASKYESEEMQAAIKEGEKSAEELAQELAKAKWKNATEHFGDIKLSLTEIQRMAEQIVWGDDMGSFEKFTTSVKAAENSLQSMKAAAEDSERWMWKASLGVKFNDDEIEAIKASFDEYINSAKSYVENKHYEFTAAVSLLVDVETEAGKSILESGNAYFMGLQEELDGLGKELSGKVSIALEDGVIDLNEEKEIANLQQQIANITNKLASAEHNAELALIKVKFGKGNLDYSSFGTFMEQMQTTIDERMTANDKAFIASVSSLELRLSEGAITQEEYDKQLQTILDGYNSSNATLRAEIRQVELQMIGEAYTDVLGEDAIEDLNNALQYAIDEGLSPIEISDEKMAELLNINLEGNGLAVENLRDMLTGVFDQLGLIPVEVDGQLYFKLTEGGTNVEEEVKKGVPDTVYDSVDVLITPVKLIEAMEQVMPEDFKIPGVVRDTVILKLNAAKTVDEQVEILATEFGIEPEEAASILWKITSSEKILNYINLKPSAVGLKNTYTHHVTYKISASYETPTPAQKFRGGLVGGSSAMESYARGGIAGFSGGGIVRGGSKLIEVAEEGSPEMIIPLSSQRRERGLQLWKKAGAMLGADKYLQKRASADTSADNQARFQYYGSGGSSGSYTAQINLGGVHIEVNATTADSQTVANAIKEKLTEVADEIAGVFADSLEAQFQNMPARGEC